MKHIVKEYYDEVKLSSEKKQAMLADILAAKRRPARRRVWITAAAVVCAVAVILAVVLPIVLREGNTDGTQIAAETTLTVEQAGPVAETRNYVSAIVLSLNPDVEIRLDAGGSVTEVVGLNDDGIALVDGIDFAGMTLENATIMVVNQLILQGYITAAEIQEEISISLSSDSMTLDTLSVMTNIIETAAAAQNIAVDVIADEDANALQIVLEGEGEPDVLPDLDPADTGGKTDIGIELEFVMQDDTYSAYVDDVQVHRSDGEALCCMVDEVDLRLNRAALRNIIELIEKGYITDSGDVGGVRFTFTGDISGSDITALADMTKLLMAEYGLHMAVTPDLDAREIVLVYDETVTHEAQTSEYTLKDVLNTMVNKDEEDLSPRQIAILKAVYTYREYQRLLEKRYYVVIPDLVGMNEDQAVDLLLQLGVVPVIGREKVPGYDPKLENGGLAKIDTTLSPEEQDQIDGPIWEFPVVDFGCVFYQDIIEGITYQTGLPLQINVIMPEDYDGPESVDDYRHDSGIVLGEMDVPFDVSAYPDTFLLSDADGFDGMIDEMNARYTIDSQTNYTVVIDRDTGWENTAVITIKHKDGFPQSKFFVQDGRIIEHEFLWRRDAPAREEAGWDNGVDDNLYDE